MNEVSGHVILTIFVLSYSEYSIGFESHLFFLIQKFDLGNKNSNNNRKEYTLVFVKEPTQGLGDTPMTTEAKYSINFTVSKNKICLSLHFYGSNSF